MIPQKKLFITDRRKKKQEEEQGRGWAASWPRVNTLDERSWRCFGAVAVAPLSSALVLSIDRGVHTIFCPKPVPRNTQQENSGDRKEHGFCATSYRKRHVSRLI